MTERLLEIRNLLLENQKVFVSDLSEQFQVSKVTIRHDLALLEEEKFAKRIHGGAVLVKSQERAIPAEDTNPLLDRIALKARDFINDGDTILLGVGMICCRLAEHLDTASDLCVFTNNIDALPALMRAHARVWLLGGEVEYGYGHHLQTNAMELTVPNEHCFTMKAFCSVGGIDLKAGLTVPVFSTANRMRQLRERTKALYLMADHTRFDHISIYSAGNIEDVDHLITDSIPQKYSTLFMRSGAQIHLA